MLQSILPFIEIVLLVATGYLYWATRKLVKNTPVPSSSIGDWTESHGESMDLHQVTMMQEVTSLLAEWQTAASTAREDWIRQQGNLQETLKQAEKTIIELRTQIDQAKTQCGTSDFGQKSDNSEMTKSAAYQRSLLPATWTEAMAAFSEHLRSNGYSQRTVIRTLSCVQRFVTWSDQQSLIQTPLHRIEVAELKTYSFYLEAQNIQPDEAESQLVAIKTFSNWLNSLFDNSPRQQKTSSISFPHTPNESGNLADKLTLTRGIERYQTVFTLFEQGVDQSVIIAQTGLEREAIRLLLTMGPPSLLTH